MIYRFPAKHRKKKVDLEKLPRQGKTEDEPIGLIQGQVPDSKQEWWTARALDRLKMSYTYQYPVMGGSARGGYKIDFLVDTVPLKTMIEIEGNHWHTGELGADDLKRQADIEDIMRDISRTPIFVLWVPDLTDMETVFQRLKTELG